MNKLLKVLTISTAVFSFSAFATSTIELYKSETCGCCEDWADIMKEKGYTVNIHNQQDWSDVKKSSGMPNQLQSCHTAVIEGYIIEGHVPETDIEKLLKEHPSDISGLSAPGMPQHSPGMAAPGQAYKDFNVVAFNKEGKIFIYNKY